MMSLEDAIRENTAAVNENCALLKQILGKAGAMSAAKTDTSAAALATAKTGDAADEEAPKTTAKGGKGGKGKASDPKGPTTADAGEFVKNWISEIEVELGDDDEPLDTPENAKLLKKRNARKAFVKLAMSKLPTPADKVADVKDAEAGQLIEWIKTKIGGTDPFAEDDDV